MARFAGALLDAGRGNSGGGGSDRFELTATASPARFNSADGGKLTILSPIAGPITVDMVKVKTFSTDGPIKIVLVDGTVINQRVTEGSDGTFETAAGGMLPAQPVPLAKIERSIQRRSRGPVRSYSMARSPRAIPMPKTIGLNAGPATPQQGRSDRSTGTISLRKAEGQRR